MPVVVPLIGAAAGIGGSLIASNGAKSAANTAAAAETAANNAAIAEQQRQFNTNQANLQPFLQGGQSALQAQLALLGLSPGTSGTGATPGMAATPGQPDYASYLQQNPDVLAGYNALPAAARAQFPTPESYAAYHYQTYGQNEGRQLGMTGGMPATAGTPATPGQSGAQIQQSAIDQLKASPLYQSLFHNGQETVLNNAAATGGLRGGNTQSSLANFGADTLAQVIQQQIANLGQVAGQGQAGANSLGNLGAASSGNISNLLAQNGQAQSGGILASSGANINAINGIQGSIQGLIRNPAFQGLFAPNYASQAAGLTGGFGNVSTPLATDISNTFALNPGIF